MDGDDCFKMKMKQCGCERTRMVMLPPPDTFPTSTCSEWSTLLRRFEPLSKALLFRVFSLSTVSKCNARNTFPSENEHRYPHSCTILCLLSTTVLHHVSPCGCLEQLTTTLLVPVVVGQHVVPTSSVNIKQHLSLAIRLSSHHPGRTATPTCA